MKNLLLKGASPGKRVRASGGPFCLRAGWEEKPDTAEHRPRPVKSGGRLYAGAPPFLTAPRGVSCPCGLLHSLLLCRWRLLMSAALLSGLFLSGTPVSASGGSVRSMENIMENRPLKADDTLQDMLEHPALRSFAKHLLPRPEDAYALCTLGTVGRLMPWHHSVQPDDVVASLNRLIRDVSAGKQVFYSFYDEKSLREKTGFFFLRGKPGAPFALICPGGGFVYVGTLHEGLPPGEIISARGYNVFILQYRTGGEETACADMAAAVSWIFRNAAKLGVGTDGWSVWGGSAGARMAADMGTYGSAALGGDPLPRPSAVIMAYTGHSLYSRSDPPTFAVVSADDPIAGPAVMRKRTDALIAAGIPAEFHLYRHASHGFGTGRGTDAWGWMDDAVRFWGEHMSGNR